MELDPSLDVRASSDILEGLDLSDRFHYGDRDVLPVAIAQLRFALGELRRVRSERITFEPLPPEFVARLDERCAGFTDGGRLTFSPRSKPPPESRCHPILRRSLRRKRFTACARNCGPSPMPRTR